MSGKGPCFISSYQSISELGRNGTLPCPHELCAFFPLQCLVLDARDLLSFLSSLPLLNRMVVFQIYLQFKLQKRNLDPLVCKRCIKDSFILDVTCAFSWIMLSVNDQQSTCAVVCGASLRSFFRELWLKKGSLYHSCASTWILVFPYIFFNHGGVCW